MIRLSFKQADFEARCAALFDRPAYPPQAETAAREIIDAVRAEGNRALVRFAEKFDHVKLTPEMFQVSAPEVEAAIKKLPAADKKAIRSALKQITDFARVTKPLNWSFSPRSGVKLGEKYTPLDRVGVYIPGGTAPLVSTVLHTAGIAKAAGVKEIVAVTPPGNIPPATLYAMKCAGVKEIYRLGGVYGVAALALGTETIRPVEKIVGPGNAYVTAAKKLLFGKVGIDLVAGPSEILIVADRRANVSFIAADLLSQAEHGSGLEQAVLVSDSQKLLDAVATEVEKQAAKLPRIETVKKVMDKGMFLICTKNLDEACRLASSYAPEHLEIQTENPEKYAKKITAAGAIFLGDWTPEPAGDFCAGPSHVLPTAGSARAFNGLETVSFMRRTSIVKYTQKALQKEIGIIERFGAMEMLAAHGNAGSIRKEK
ncbi:MAG: histidinol dehydrogenase [Victivallaceae bacterium]|nr:histidinol dehydrogenase [Victivallaceae bacterium]